MLLCNTFVLTYPEPPTSESADDDDDEELGTFALFASILVIPRQLNSIYALQFAWWYVVQNQLVWWTTWISLELFNGDFDEGVRWGVFTLLIQSCVAVIATRSFVPWLGNTLGLTRSYHLASFTYALGSVTLYFLPSIWTPLIYMALSGLVQPFLNSAPYVLIEMYLEDDDKPHPSHSGLSPAPMAMQASSPTSATLSEPVKAETEDADTTRGVLTALMNLCMVVAQIIVASTSGLIVEATGHISSTFLTSALFMIVLNTLIYTMGWSFNEAEEEEEGSAEDDEMPGFGDATSLKDEDLKADDAEEEEARNPRRSRRKLPVSGFGDASYSSTDTDQDLGRRRFKRVEYDSVTGAANANRKKITVALPKSQAKIMREHMKRYQAVGYGSYDEDSENYSSGAGAGEHSASKPKFRKANRFTRAGSVTVDQSDVLAHRRKEEREEQRSRIASIAARRRRRRAETRRRASLPSLWEEQ